MHLIFDRIYPDDFSQCKGAGKCGTFLIEILNNTELANQRQQNETTTLSKMENSYANSKLACQILIDENINNLHCKISSEANQTIILNYKN